MKQTVAFEDAVPGAVIAVQSFGDFLGFNSHLHVIGTDGCFYGNGSFKTCPTPNPKDLEDLFHYEVFKMLKSEGKINDFLIENMINWPPARRAYGSESATADSMFIAVMPSGPIMKFAPGGEN